MSIDSDFAKLLSESSDDPTMTRDRLVSLLLVHVRQQRAATEELRGAIQKLPDQISAAVENGMRKVATDEVVTKNFYTRLADHATNGVSQWVGKRVLLILVAAALSASIGWAVLTGRLK